MDVKTTQFLRPNGKQEESTCTGVSDALLPKYQAIQRLGLRLTCEVLMTGVISQTIEHEEGDFDIELCQNEPNAPRAALEKLLERFDETKFQEWLKEIAA